MSDLLTKMGQKMAEGKESSSEPSVTETTSGTTLAGKDSIPGVEVGDNLTDKVTDTKPEEGKAAANTEDSSKSVQDPSSWTMESAALEIKKAREEAKQRRLQMKEQESKFQEDLNKLKLEMQEKLESASQAQKELEALKHKEEDKKRSMEEKLAHREARLAEYEAKLQQIEANYESKVGELSSKLKDYEIQQEAQMNVFRERITDVINNIPESKRKFAEMIAKGYADPQEAWSALNEAKVQGLFDEKQVVVSHATPGAGAARMTQDKLDAAKAEARSKMSSSQKIAEGLKAVSGEKGLRGKIL